MMSEDVEVNSEVNYIILSVNKEIKWRKSGNVYGNFRVKTHYFFIYGL